MLLPAAHLGVLMLRATSKLEVKTSESWERKPLSFKSTDLKLSCPHGLKPDWDTTQETPAFGLFFV